MRGHLTTVSRPTAARLQIGMNVKSLGWAAAEAGALGPQEELRVYG
jgi:hypothetical protein